MNPSPILYWVRKADAVIDWLDVEFTTLGRHNGGKLKAKLGASHVTPINPGPGDYATHFVARFQDPGPLAQVYQRLREAGAALEQGVFVPAIEIAFDLYVHDNDRDMLAQLADHLYKFTAKVADPKNHRTVNGRDGNTHYIGNQGSNTIPAAPVSQRVYVKTKDNNKQPLPPELHRARYEITLTGSGVPFSTLDEAAAFNFTELASWFKWRMLKDGLGFLELVSINNSKQVGSRRLVKLRQGGRREFDPRTVADIELNKRAHDALRGLTRRSGRGFRSLSSDFSEPKWPAYRGEQGAVSDNSNIYSASPLQLHHQVNDQQGDDWGYDKELIAELAKLLEPLPAGVANSRCHPSGA